MELQARTPTQRSQVMDQSAADRQLEEARRRLFDPSSREFLDDPYAVYRVLRERRPIYFDPDLQAWILTRFADIQALLRDSRFGPDPARRFELIHGEGINEEPVCRNWNLSMLSRNGPDHTRLRRLVAGWFTARRVQELEPSIGRITHDLIDRMPEHGDVDLLHSFARPLPVNVICELMGIPEADRRRFIDERAFSERILQPVPITREELAEENARICELRDYFLSLCAERRRAPGEDLISHLVAGLDRGELDQEELVAMLFLIFLAGHDTTVNLIGNGMVALHRSPDQLALLRARPELLPTAVEELLRYDSPAQAIGRCAFEPVELAGQRIEAGQQVVGVLGAANRDPEVYTDPDRLDLTRTGIKPVAFGGGVHFCLGAQLARIEGQIALGALLDRLPDLSLPQATVPRWNGNIFLRGVEALPACYSRKSDRGAAGPSDAHRKDADGLELSVALRPSGQRAG